MVKVEVGNCIRVQTKTLNDVFGVCYYEILETGLPAPEAHRRGCMDGVKARMMGGSGPSAREGLIIHDSQDKIGSEIKSGIIEVMSKEKAELLLSAIEKNNLSTVDGVRPPAGVMEID